MLRWYILCALITGIYQSVTPETPKTTSYDVLAKLYLPSLTKHEEKALSKKKSKIKVNDLKNSTLEPVEKLTIIYDLFAHNDNIPGSAINTQLYQDLEFFSGSHHLLGLFSPATAMGNVELQKLLALPIIDIEKLQSRQAFIAQLMSNPDLLAKLEQQLETLKNQEREFLSFWKTLDTASSMLFEKSYFEWFPQLNKNQYALEISALWKSIGKPTLPFLACVLGICWIQYTIITQVSVTNHCYYKPAYTSFGAYLRMWVREMKLFNPNCAIPAAIILGSLLAMYPGISTAIEDHKISNLIQQKMIAVASFSQALKTIDETLPTTITLPNTLKEFLLTLESNTFKGSPSFFSFKGKALLAFKTMFEIKDQFEPILKKIGEIDAFVSVAKFLKETMHNQNAQFCFAEYEESQTPHIALTNCWHPLLNQNTVVTNNFEFSELAQAPKEVIIALILAQTLGIAPAANMTFTPLDHIFSIF